MALWNSWALFMIVPSNRTYLSFCTCNLYKLITFNKNTNQLMNFFKELKSFSIRVFHHKRKAFVFLPITLFASCSSWKIIKNYINFWRILLKLSTAWKCPRNSNSKCAYISSAVTLIHKKWKDFVWSCLNILKFLSQSSLMLNLQKCLIRLRWTNNSKKTIKRSLIDFANCFGFLREI
jgi:hypothetical protein